MDSGLLKIGMVSSDLAYDMVGDKEALKGNSDCNAEAYNEGVESLSLGLQQDL